MILCRRGWAVLLIFFLLCGCASTPEAIRDIALLPQDNAYYLDARTADRELLAPEDLREASRAFDRMFYLPWHQNGPSASREEILEACLKYRHDPGYGENERKHSSSWIEALLANADLESYPNAGYKAVTLVDTDLRLLPTHRPLFSNPFVPGSGYPFDNLQNSAIAAETPVFITQRTRDGAWLFAESHTSLGWIPARDVARVDAAMAEAWERWPLLAVVHEESPVCDPSGNFLFMARVGTLLPELADEGECYRVGVAVADENGHAKIRETTLPKEAAVRRPMPLTPSRVARLANGFLGQPYGWGGLYQDRDCSSTLKDLFTPFGLWLPRHSSDQALHGGRFVDLVGLNAKEKERKILSEGLPYATLLWATGHIMLYIGSFRGRAVVFHNLWGVRTEDLRGKEGRAVIGRAVITTLFPGTKLYNLDRSKGELIDRILGMTVLVRAAPRGK